jgi:hypothetical protein
MTGRKVFRESKEYRVRLARTVQRALKALLVLVAHVCRS